MSECNSCIHRNVCFHKTNIETETYAYMGVKFDAKKCKHFMSADVVEVVHSTWTLNKDGSGTCDRCGMTQKGVWDYDNWQNYCGYCGARMGGERKEQSGV